MHWRKKSKQESQRHSPQDPLWNLLTTQKQRFKETIYHTRNKVTLRYHHLPYCCNSTIFGTVTGQLADTPTRGLPTRRLDISRTGQLADCQLADWTSRGLDNSRSRRCCHKGKLTTQSRRWHPRAVQSATCPVRELSSPRVDQSARCPDRELAIRELSSYPSKSQRATMKSHAATLSRYRVARQSRATKSQV